MSIPVSIIVVQTSTLKVMEIIHHPTSSRSRIAVTIHFGTFCQPFGFLYFIEIISLSSACLEGDLLPDRTELLLADL